MALCAAILKSILGCLNHNFPFGKNGKLLVLGNPINGFRCLPIYIRAKPVSYYQNQYGRLCS